MRRSFVAGVAVLLGVSVLAAACSGGGGGSSDDAADPLEDLRGGPGGERQVNFNGAGGFKLSGTLTVPGNASGPVPGVLIVSSLAPNIDRDGIQTPTNPDLLYKELSTAFTSAGMATLRFDPRGIGASKVEAGGKKPTYDDVVEDATAAVRFLAQRREVGSAPVAVVGHDVGGLVAMRVAANESRVKSLVLVSTPGRPVIDVVADGLSSVYDATAADQYRKLAGDVRATGTLPPADQIPSQLQSVLGQGQEQLLKGIFSVDPVAEARAVKVPTLLMLGAKSTGVKQVDADRLVQAIGAKTEVAISPEGPTLRESKPDAPALPFDPNNEATHAGGFRPITGIPRDQAAIDKIASYASTTLKAART